VANTVAAIDGEEEAKHQAKLNEQGPANVGVTAAKEAQAQFDEEKKKAKEADEEAEAGENDAKAKEAGEKAKGEKQEADLAQKEKSIKYSDDENWILEMPEKALKMSL